MNLCLSCGLCCNGLLFKDLPLTEEELIPFVELKPKTEKRGSGLFLSLPCIAWESDKGCTKYNDRPKVCRDFKCKVLVKYENKELTYEQAMEKINFIKTENILEYKNGQERKKKLIDFIE
jgi:Fe-S-cluster containining protein